MRVENKCLLGALLAFGYEEKITEFKPFGSGHINDTYAVWVEDGGGTRPAYILQRLNTNVFKKPDEVMQNIFGVTEYLRQKKKENKQSVKRGVLHFLKTIDGKRAYYDAQGMPWRSYRFVENSFCYQQSPSKEIFYQSARAFGDFLQSLSDYPAETLHETIPYFHDTRRRMQDLRVAVQEDKFGRAKGCQADIDFALAREEEAGLLMRMLEAGELPLRVTHNDTKLNNILFDKDTNEAICIIDLDTIMPGLSLNDYGDSIRFGATSAAEDEKDLSKVNFSLDLFSAYTKGFLETAGAALTNNEKKMLPEGARIITLECGVRFLTDHLNGDVYFKVSRENQNLDRSRTQFKLVQDMEQSFEIMQEIVEIYS